MFSLPLAMLFSVPTPVTTDCVYVTVDVAEAFEQADVVFSGTVIGIDDIDDRLHFRVDHVWKGAVGKEMWIWQLGIPYIGSYVFRPQPTMRYIIFARKLSPDERGVRTKPGESVAFGIPRFCGEGPRWSPEMVRELDRLVKRKRNS